MSSITKKANGSYYARWRDPSGTQKAKTFGRKVDAERFLASVTIDSLSGRYVDPRAGRTTVKEYVSDWVDGQPWRESTRAARAVGQSPPARWSRAAGHRAETVR